MKRGKQKLYNPIVPKLVTDAGSQGQRNAGIDERRNAMAYRYYFHATINRYLYEDCLFNLRLEFFLQEDTIVKELLLRNDLITQLARANTTTAELRRKYPFYNWISKP